MVLLGGAVITYGKIGGRSENGKNHYFFRENAYKRFSIFYLVNDKKNFKLLTIFFHFLVVHVRQKSPVADQKMGKKYVSCFRKLKKVRLQTFFNILLSKKFQITKKFFFHFLVVHIISAADPKM